LANIYRGPYYKYITLERKVSRVRPILKFGLVGFDQKFVKFYGVRHMDTSFKKFNLNLFYEKWIMNFELDSHIWIWI